MKKAIPVDKRGGRFGRMDEPQVTCKQCNGPLTEGGWCLACGPTDEQLETYAAACDRCKYRDLPKPWGKGRERFITGKGGPADLTLPDGRTLHVVFPAGSHRLWLCDACWTETAPAKGSA